MEVRGNTENKLSTKYRLGIRDRIHMVYRDRKK